jgi:hypothetical protein
MYTTYGTGFGKFSQTYHIGTRKYGHKPGHQEQKEKKTPSSRKPHGFLNTRISSIAPDLYVENDRDVTVNVTTKENLDFLYRSAMKYAQLLDVELPYHPTGRTSIREKICLLYNALDSIVSHHVNLELVGDRLQFCVYHFHEWPDYTLFLIPIDFTEKLKGEIKRITLEFIRRFIKYHRMMDITDTPYFEMSEVCIDYVDFEQLDEEEKKDLYRKEKLFRSYEKGRIHRKLCRMHSKAFCRNLEEHIRNCNPSSDKERRLMELITEGLSLIAKDSPHILNYDYDYASEKERDFEPPPLEYQILLTYSITDTVTKDMESCFSTDCQETYNQTPVSFTFITPETEKLFRPENYPERFSKWFEKFVEHVTYNL